MPSLSPSSGTTRCISAMKACASRFGINATCVNDYSPGCCDGYDRIIDCSQSDENCGDADGQQAMKDLSSRRNVNCDAGGTSAAVIAGAVVGSLISVALICTLVVILVLKYRHRTEGVRGDTSLPNDSMEAQMVRSGTAALAEDMIPSAILNFDPDAIHAANTNTSGGPSSGGGVTF